MSDIMNENFLDVSKVVVWGDSVARGIVFDSDTNKYTFSKSSAVSRLTSKLGIEIVNRSHMGYTVDKGLQLISSDLNKGMSGDIAFVEYGGNDSDFNWTEISNDPESKHLPKTPLDIFEKNLRMIIEKLNLANFRVALSTLPPIMADKYFDFITRNGLSKDNILKWLGDKYQIYRFHERYSLMIQRLAREYDCILFDLRSAFLSKWNNGDFICADGVHPNDNGQILISDAIISELNGTPLIAFE